MSNQKQKTRQASALKRLEAQLHSGKKTAKKSGNKIELSDGDRKRIEREIGILSK